MNVIETNANAQLVTLARSASQRWESQTLSAVHAIAMDRATENLIGTGR